MDHADEPLICNVNDHEAARYVISRMLRHAGYPVTEAETGAQALAAARRDRPAVMVLDLQLPDIDGNEVCRRLKADPATAAIAVLQTSASVATSDARVHGLESGADAFLAQPFTADELLATVRSLLRLRERETTQQRRADAFAAAGRRKDEFLGMLDHELRNPLAAVTSALAVLARHPPRDPAEERARDIARRQMAQLTQVVDDLLAVSRVMRGAVTLARERLDLRALVDDAIDISERTCLAGRDRRISRALPPRPVHVDGDRAHLAQVLAGLLDHAARYTREGGRIAVSLAEEDGHAVVRVSDDGVGIGPDAPGNIFDVFCRSGAPVRRPSDGLGLGLTLVHALVELHGGTVVASSDGPGRGTTLAVRLPAVVVAPAVPPPAAAPAAFARARVLVVEGDADTRVALRDLCRTWGHEVLVAGDGPLAVELALRFGPDVALIDLGLPGLDGFEVARRIRADPRGAAVRLAALTSFGSPELRTAATSVGFELHLVKPADPERLAEFIACARTPAASPPASVR